MTIKISKMRDKPRPRHLMAHLSCVMPKFVDLLRAAKVNGTTLRRLATAIERGLREGTETREQDEKYIELVNRVLVALVDNDEVRQYTARAIKRYRGRLTGLTPWVWVGPRGEWLDLGGYVPWRDYAYDGSLEHPGEMVLLLLATVDEMSRGLEVEVEFPKNFRVWYDESAVHPQDCAIDLWVKNAGESGSRVDTFVAW